MTKGKPLSNFFREITAFSNVPGNFRFWEKQTIYKVDVCVTLSYTFFLPSFEVLAKTRLSAHYFEIKKFIQFLI